MIQLTENKPDSGFRLFFLNQLWQTKKSRLVPNDKQTKQKTEFPFDKCICNVDVITFMARLSCVGTQGEKLVVGSNE